MKTTTRLIAVILLLSMVAALFAGCGGNSAKAYIGRWDAYKIAAEDEELVFADYDSFVKLEYTAIIEEDGSYELHYYVNGEEGTQYPKYGSYKIEDGKIVLIEEDGIGEIVDGELVFYFDDGGVRQYFRKNP